MAGDENIGSAFHVGDGIFVTARHVIENKVRCQIEVGNVRFESIDSTKKESSTYGQSKQIEVHGLPHPDPSVDVAVFTAPDLVTLPIIPLGSHLDDWILDEEFILNEVIVLGYPPIPLASRAVLVAARGQVNAVIDLINTPHVHYIVSVTPRGGFSGGAVVSEWGVVLGLVTSSLVKNHAPEELGYLTVLTVEPILECLGAHKLMPNEVAEIWNGLFTSETLYFGKPELRWAQAWIEMDRDGRRTRLQFACPADHVEAEAIRAAMKAIGGLSFEHRIIPKDVNEITLKGNSEELEGALHRMAESVQEVFEKNNFHLVNQPLYHSRTLDPPFMINMS